MAREPGQHGWAGRAWQRKAFLLLAWVLLFPMQAAAIPPGAVVFAYNRFGEDRLPSASIRLDQFEAHLEELQDDAYHVLPLEDVVEALRGEAPLPDRSVAITVDEATRSFFLHAWPRLRAAGLPVTLFVATDAVDRGLASSMTWAELRQVMAAGVTIGAMAASGQPMAGRTLPEVRADLERAASRLETELGQRPHLFAYPSGAYSLAARALVSQAGYSAAFAQQSGVAAKGADLLVLPRFVMNEAFGSIDRFTLAANALPLPVSDITPAEPVLTTNPPIIGFTVSASLGNIDRLACFASGQGRAPLERPGGGRIELRLGDPLPPGRARINCTLPAEDDRWRWFGLQLFVPE